MAHRIRLDLLAERGVVTAEQLRAAGFSRDAILHLERSRRIFRLYRGVFAVGRPDLTREGKWLAAVLACGEGAALSHLDACSLLSLLDRPTARPHVTVPTQAGRPGPRGVILHRSDTFTPEDRTAWLGIPVTTVERTLLDITLHVDRRTLRRAIRAAVREHRIDLVALDAAVSEPRTSPKHARLRRALAIYVAGEEMTDSEFEARFFEMCARARLPAPERQYGVGPYRLDFAWPELRLAVETDGRAHHSGRVAFIDDRRRDRHLAALGWEVLHFAWGEVVAQPESTAREIRAAIRRRRQVQAAS